VCLLAFYEREDGVLVDDQVLLVVDLELGARVLLIQDLVADSFAVSGRTRPLFVISSRCSGLMTTRAPRGLSFLLAVGLVAGLSATAVAMCSLPPI